MKNIRKISAMLVALAVMASFCVPALAVPTTQEVDDIAFYNSFENYNAGVGAHNSLLAAGANGWYLWSGSRSYVTYSELNGEVVTNINIAKDAKEYETFAYTLKNGDAFTGNIALETKLMPTADEEFEIRILNRNLTAEGGTTYNAGDAVGTNHMIYGVLNFTNGKLRYTNVNSAPKAEGGYGDVTTTSESAPAAVNEWVTLRYEIDTDSETYSLYANGTELFKDAPMFIKEKAEADRSFAQSVTNIGYMTVRKTKNQPLYLYVDDVAVYDLASTTKYYWGDATVSEYNCNVGDTLYDAKVEVPLVDANGAATTKTVKTPVRLAKLDSSKPGIQLTTADGLTGSVKLNVNKQGVLTEGDTWEETNFSSYTNGINNAKTETENGNNFLRVTANSYTTNAYLFNNKDRFAGAYDFEISFKIRFSGTATGMTNQNNAFVVQLLNGTGTIEMPTLYFMPSGSGCTVRYAKTQNPSQEYGTKGAMQLTGSWTPLSTDLTWHTVKVTYSDGKLKVYIDDKQGTFNNHGTTTGADNGTFTESLAPEDFTVGRIVFKFNNAGQTTAVADLDDFKIEVPEVTGNITLDTIGEQEWTTAKGAITLPTQVKGTLSDGSDAYYDIISLTAVDAEATDVGEYIYTASVVGYDSPVTVKVNVLENAYTLSNPTATEVAVTKNVSHESPAKLFVAIFRDERLVDVQQKAISATDSYAIDMESESGDVIKAFVWNVNDITPLALSAEGIVAE